MSEMWFSLFEHSANHEGSVFVLWCGDKVMTGRVSAERGTWVGGKERKEKKKSLLEEIRTSRIN